MSLYTTGELAKLCDVSVRTVQYYDTRNLLKPSELSEGGRRLYTEDDVRKMKIICFLREADISIQNIEKLFLEEESDKVIVYLMEQQEQILKNELAQRQAKLEHLTQIKRELKNVEHFSVDSLGDIAYVMQNKKNMQKLHVLMLIIGIPLDIFEWGAFLYGIIAEVWWPMLVWVFVDIIGGVWVIKHYFKKVIFICPECHSLFKPKLKEVFFAKHTQTLRKLTCTHCGYHGFCIETYGKETE